jgi:hypothetical protein
MSESRRRLAGPLDFVLVAAVVLIAALAAYRIAGRTDPAAALRKIPSTEGGTIVLVLEIPDLHPDLARLVRVGDKFIVGGEELAAIESVNPVSDEVLSYQDANGTIVSAPSGRVRLEARVRVPRWLDEMTKFQLGSAADFASERYSVPVRIVGIEEPREEPPLPQDPGLDVVAAVLDVPEYIRRAAVPGTLGVDSLGHPRIRIEEIAGDEPSAAMRLYLSNDYSAYGDLSLAGNIRLSKGGSRDLVLKLRMWPDSMAGAPSYQGKEIKPGCRIRMAFRRFSFEVQVVSVAPAHEQGNR